ncbi:MAG: hypothetical protein RIQ53_2721 [Pseudomonadota bacterium]
MVNVDSAIERAVAAVTPLLGPEMERQLAVLEADLRRSGVALRTLTSAELDAWTDATRYREVQAAWVRDQTARGLTSASTVLRQIEQLLADAAP